MYCDSWKLKISVDKTKIIIFNNGKTDTKSLTFMIHNSEIEIAEKFVRLSLLTMINPNQLCDVLLFVCSKMADETNLSSKLPVADRTREV